MNRLDKTLTILRLGTGANVPTKAKETGRIELLSVNSLTAGKATAPTPTTQKKLTQTHTTVLVVKCSRGCMEEAAYHKAVNAYTSAIKSWVSRRNLDGLQDSWRWNREKVSGKLNVEFACELMRVTSSHVCQFPRTRGHAGVSVEPADFKHPVWQKENLQFKV